MKCSIYALWHNILFLPLQVLAHFDKSSSDLCHASLDGVGLDGEGAAWI